MSQFNPFYTPTTQDEINRQLEARRSIMDAQYGIQQDPRLIEQIIGSAIQEPLAIQSALSRRRHRGPGIPLGKLAPYLKNILR